MNKEKEKGKEEKKVKVGGGREISGGREGRRLLDLGEIAPPVSGNLKNMFSRVLILFLVVNKALREGY